MGLVPPKEKWHRKEHINIMIIIIIITVWLPSDLSLATVWPSSDLKSAYSPVTI